MTPELFPTCGHIRPLYYFLFAIGKSGHRILKLWMISIMATPESLLMHFHLKWSLSEILMVVCTILSNSLNSDVTYLVAAASCTVGVGQNSKMLIIKTLG